MLVPVNDETTLLLQTDPALGLPPWLRFVHPQRILCAHRLADVLGVLAEAERARQEGSWVAGFVTYEAAPAFDGAMTAHAPGPLPLVWLGVYAEPGPASPPGDNPGHSGLALEPDLDAAAYACHLASIKDAIARGETYQVNFTLRLRGPAALDPEAAFAHLYHAQPGGYAACFTHRDFSICSASPELFFLQSGDHITCRPMKGTAPRGCSWADDERRGLTLQQSSKERAENVMIVDMVRNDLGRLAPAGSVETPRLFEVQRLPTLWQMTSTVIARTEAGLPELFSALFPCASITGAPKIKTMEIIRHLESGPRGIYTGALGFAGPGRKAQFNVAIRTLVLDHNRRTAEYGIGSGVVWDSRPACEYEECLSKAWVLGPRARRFDLLATLAWRPETGFVLLHRHLRRLERAARYFGFSFSAAGIAQALQEAVPRFNGTPSRVRLLVDPAGQPTIAHGSLPPVLSHPWRVALSSQPVSSTDRFLYFKTTRREVYEQARSSRPDLDDVILWNERGEITESCLANLALCRNGQWITPPVSCGLLEGIMREELLAQGILREEVIHLDDLARAEGLALLNSLRGWIPARLSRSQPEDIGQVLLREKIDAQQTLAQVEQQEDGYR